MIIFDIYHYRVHFSHLQELRKNNLSISAAMVGNLALLHRYTLVRTHVKIGDHQQAAKLLIQVAANISRFPAREHKLPILICFFLFTSQTPIRLL